MDKVEEALAHVAGSGTGEAARNLRWYRIIEAEAISRSKSLTRRIDSWLSFEYVPGEVLDLRPALEARILKACQEMGDGLGWDHSVGTLVCILAEETDAPWASYPFGYCVEKEHYQKICLPGYLVDDPDEFSQAVAHEYAHVIADGLSEGNAPRWLEEAVAVLAEGPLDNSSVLKLREGSWISPSKLELAFDAPEQEGADRIWLAYQQAGWVGKYLETLGGKLGVARLLRELAEESWMRNLVLSVRGQDRIEGALRATFGINTKQLFSRSFEHMCSLQGTELA